MMKYSNTTVNCHIIFGIFKKIIESWLILLENLYGKNRIWVQNVDEKSDPAPHHFENRRGKVIMTFSNQSYF